MLNFEIHPGEGTVVLEPAGRLQKESFEELTRAVDAYIEENGPVHGLVIHTKTFPGWEDFGAVLGHMRFVRDHHRKIERVALVTDSKLGQILPKFASHFVAAEIKHFAYDDMRSAQAWVAED
jgi:hypothetical protein